MALRVGKAGGHQRPQGHGPHSGTRRISGAYPNVARGTPEHATASRGASPREAVELENVDFLKDAPHEINNSNGRWQ